MLRFIKQSVVLFVGVLVAAPSAFAGWEQQELLKEVDTRDPQEIVAELVQFPEILNYLNAENLISPSRVKVLRFSARVARYLWQNDDECNIKEPGSVEPVEMSASHAEFIHESRPSKTWVIDVLSSHPDPCSAKGLGVSTSLARVVSKSL